MNTKSKTKTMEGNLVVERDIWTINLTNLSPMTMKRWNRWERERRSCWWRFKARRRRRWKW